MKVYYEKNFIRLECDFGYLIHNKVGGTYSKMFYVPNGADLNNFEEVVDPDVDNSIASKFHELEQKEQSLTKAAKVVAKQVTDDETALELQEFYDKWVVGKAYKTGEYVLFEGVLFKVLNDHTSQADWVPNAAPSLFVNVLTSIDGTPQEWVQPDSTNPYMIGDKVIFEGVVYESVIDNNVWSPAANPAGWKVVE